VDFIAILYAMVSSANIVVWWILDRL